MTANIQFSDREIQVIQALSLSADEIVKNNIHFTDTEAKLISVRKVSKSGAEKCRLLLADLKRDLDPDKKWWEFWK